MVASSRGIEDTVPIRFVPEGITHHIKPAQIIAKLKIWRWSKHFLACNFDHSLGIIIQKEYMVVEFSCAASAAKVTNEPNFSDYLFKPVIREVNYTEYLMLYFVRFYAYCRQSNS